MRLNQFLSQNTALSRRGADKEIERGSVMINGIQASLGASVDEKDQVFLYGRLVKQVPAFTTILFNKPTGYICSRIGQGNKTIYDILPMQYHRLNPVGRLDKDSSGLLMLTNDGELANKLTHPRYQKVKKYEIHIDKPLQPLHQQMINDIGITLSDGLSRLSLHKLDQKGIEFEIIMKEGRNRQIRRTFSALGYRVLDLHRTQFGDYRIDNITFGSIKIL